MADKEIIFPPPPKDPDPEELRRWYERVCELINNLNARLTVLEP